MSTRRRRRATIKDIQRTRAELERQLIECRVMIFDEAFKLEIGRQRRGESGRYVR
jgi:hypothetical protein